MPSFQLLAPRGWAGVELCVSLLERRRVTQVLSELLHALTGVPGWGFAFEGFGLHLSLKLDTKIICYSFCKVQSRRQLEAGNQGLELTP